MKALFSRQALLLMLCLMPGISFPQNHEPDYARIITDIESYLPVSGKQSVTLDDGTLCIFELKDGILHGSWVSFYSNGKKKASGRFEHNSPVGKWKIRDGDTHAYMIADLGHPYAYEVRRIRQSLFRYPVKWGRGTAEFSVSDGYQGLVRYRKGLKSGSSVIFRDEKNIMAKLSYREGLYDGECIWHQPDGNTLLAKYRAGHPSGIWKIFNPDGSLISEDNFETEPWVQRVPDRLYIHSDDVIWEQRTTVAIPANHPQNRELFEQDDEGISLYSIFKDAFVKDKTVFYKDMSLQLPLFSSRSRPQLSELPDETEKNARPVMLFFTEFHIFTTQLTHVSNMILVMTLILQYEEDEAIRYESLPFVYYPMVSYEISSEKLKGQPLGSYLKKMLDGYYFSITLSEQTSRERYFYEDYENHQWIDAGRKSVIERIDKTHQLWLDHHIRHH